MEGIFVGLDTARSDPDHKAVFRACRLKLSLLVENVADLAQQRIERERFLKNDRVGVQIAP